VKQPALGYENEYEVYEDGRIFGLKRKKFLSQGNVNGYKNVTLHKDGVGTTKYVHQVVMEAFNGPCPERMEVAHKDGSRDNNHLSNLVYTSRIDNHAMRWEHGTMLTGERNPNCKIPDAERQDIRHDYDMHGLTIAEITRKYGRNYNTIWRIVHP